MEKINLAEKFSMIQEYWDPRIAGELNGQMVKLVKINGPFAWHKHDDEDEMFLVVKGSFNMELRDPEKSGADKIVLNAGEFLIVPRGVEHRPNAEMECEVMLFEPASTLNTGNQKNEFTKEKLKNI
ncbi:MAG: cupin domain-containing protein [Chitinophagales bacterium]